jgi:hypothetical protein
MSLNEAQKIKLDIFLKEANWPEYKDIKEVIDHCSSRLESASIQEMELIQAAKTSSALQVEAIAGHRQEMTLNGFLPRIQAHLYLAIQWIRGK